MSESLVLPAFAAKILSAVYIPYFRTFEHLLREVADVLFEAAEDSDKLAAEVYDSIKDMPREAQWRGLSGESFSSGAINAAHEALLAQAERCRTMAQHADNSAMNVEYTKYLLKYMLFFGAVLNAVVLGVLRKPMSDLWWLKFVVAAALQAAVALGADAHIQHRQINEKHRPHWDGWATASAVISSALGGAAGMGANTLMERALQPHIQMASGALRAWYGALGVGGGALGDGLGEAFGEAGAAYVLGRLQGKSDDQIWNEIKQSLGPAFVAGAAMGVPGGLISGLHGFTPDKQSATEDLKSYEALSDGEARQKLEEVPSVYVEQAREILQGYGLSKDGDVPPQKLLFAAKQLEKHESQQHAIPHSAVLDQPLTHAPFVTDDNRTGPSQELLRAADIAELPVDRRFNADPAYGEVPPSEILGRFIGDKIHEATGDKAFARNELSDSAAQWLGSVNQPHDSQQVGEQRNGPSVSQIPAELRQRGMQTPIFALMAGYVENGLVGARNGVYHQAPTALDAGAELARIGFAMRESDPGFQGFSRALGLILANMNLEQRLAFMASAVRVPTLGREFAEATQAGIAMDTTVQDGELLAERLFDVVHVHRETRGGLPSHEELAHALQTGKRPDPYPEAYRGGKGIRLRFRRGIFAALRDVAGLLSETKTNVIGGRKTYNITGAELRKLSVEAETAPVVLGEAMQEYVRKRRVRESDFRMRMLDRSAFGSALDVGKLLREERSNSHEARSLAEFLARSANIRDSDAVDVRSVVCFGNGVAVEKLPSIYQALRDGGQASDLPEASYRSRVSYLEKWDYTEQIAEVKRKLEVFLTGELRKSHEIHAISENENIRVPFASMFELFGPKEFQGYLDREKRLASPEALLDYLKGKAVSKEGGIAGWRSHKVDNSASPLPIGTSTERTQAGEVEPQASAVAGAPKRLGGGGPHRNRLGVDPDSMLGKPLSHIPKRGGAGGKGAAGGGGGSERPAWSAQTQLARVPEVRDALQELDVAEPQRATPEQVIEALGTPSVFWHAWVLRPGSVLELVRTHRDSSAVKALLSKAEEYRRTSGLDSWPATRRETASLQSKLVEKMVDGDDLPHEIGELVPKWHEAPWEMERFGRARPDLIEDLYGVMDYIDDIMQLVGLRNRVSWASGDIARDSDSWFLDRELPEDMRQSEMGMEEVGPFLSMAIDDNFVDLDLEGPLSSPQRIDELVNAYRPRMLAREAGGVAAESLSFHGWWGEAPCAVELVRRGGQFFATVTDVRNGTELTSHRKLFESGDLDAAYAFFDHAHRELQARNGQSEVLAIILDQFMHRKDFASDLREQMRFAGITFDDVMNAPMALLPVLKQYVKSHVGIIANFDESVDVKRALRDDAYVENVLSRKFVEYRAAVAARLLPLDGSVEWPSASVEGRTPLSAVEYEGLPVKECLWLEALESEFWYRAGVLDGPAKALQEAIEGQLDAQTYRTYQIMLRLLLRDWPLVKPEHQPESTLLSYMELALRATNQDLDNLDLQRETRQQIDQLISLRSWGLGGGLEPQQRQPVEIPVGEFETAEILAALDDSSGVVKRSQASFRFEPQLVWLQRGPEQRLYEVSIVDTPEARRYLVSDSATGDLAVFSREGASVPEWQGHLGGSRAVAGDMHERRATVTAEFLRAARPDLAGKLDAVEARQPGFQQGCARVAQEAWRHPETADFVGDYVQLRYDALFPRVEMNPPELPRVETRIAHATSLENPFTEFIFDADGARVLAREELPEQHETGSQYHEDDDRLCADVEQVSERRLRSKADVVAHLTVDSAAALEQLVKRPEALARLVNEVGQEHPVQAAAAMRTLGKRLAQLQRATTGQDQVRSTLVELIRETGIAHPEGHPTLDRQGHTSRIQRLWQLWRDHPLTLLLTMIDDPEGVQRTIDNAFKSALTSDYGPSHDRVVHEIAQAAAMVDRASGLIGMQPRSGMSIRIDVEGGLGDVSDRPGRNTGDKDVRVHGVEGRQQWPSAPTAEAPRFALATDNLEQIARGLLFLEHKLGGVLPRVELKAYQTRLKWMLTGFGPGSEHFASNVDRLPDTASRTSPTIFTKLFTDLWAKFVGNAWSVLRTPEILRGSDLSRFDLISQTVLQGEEHAAFTHALGRAFEDNFDNYVSWISTRRNVDESRAAQNMISFKILAAAEDAIRLDSLLASSGLSVHAAQEIRFRAPEWRRKLLLEVSSLSPHVIREVCHARLKSPESTPERPQSEITPGELAALRTLDSQGETRKVQDFCDLLNVSHWKAERAIKRHAPSPREIAVRLEEHIQVSTHLTAPQWPKRLVRAFLTGMSNGGSLKQIARSLHEGEKSIEALRDSIVRFFAAEFRGRSLNHPVFVLGYLRALSEEFGQKFDVNPKTAADALRALGAHRELARNVIDKYGHEYLIEAIPFVDRTKIEALNHLDLIQREIMIWSYFGGFGDVEIAKSLGTTPEAVREHLESSYRFIEAYYSFEQNPFLLDSGSSGEAVNSTLRVQPSRWVSDPDKSRQGVSESTGETEPDSGVLRGLPKVDREKDKYALAEAAGNQRRTGSKSDLEIISAEIPTKTKVISAIAEGRSREDIAEITGLKPSSITQIAADFRRMLSAQSLRLTDVEHRESVAAKYGLQPEVVAEAAKVLEQRKGGSGQKSEGAGKVRQSAGMWRPTEALPVDFSAEGIGGNDARSWDRRGINPETGVDEFGREYPMGSHGRRANNPFPLASELADSYEENEQEGPVAHDPALKGEQQSLWDSLSHEQREKLQSIAGSAEDTSPPEVGASRAAGQNGSKDARTGETIPGYFPPDIEGPKARTDTSLPLPELSQPSSPITTEPTAPAAPREPQLSGTLADLLSALTPMGRTAQEKATAILVLSEPETGRAFAENVIKGSPARKTELINGAFNRLANQALGPDFLRKLSPDDSARQLLASSRFQKILAPINNAGKTIAEPGIMNRMRSYFPRYVLDHGITSTEIDSAHFIRNFTDHAQRGKVTELVDYYRKTSEIAGVDTKLSGIEVRFWELSPLKQSMVGYRITHEFPGKHNQANPAKFINAFEAAINEAGGDLGRFHKAFPADAEVFDQLSIDERRKVMMNWNPESVTWTLTRTDPAFSSQAKLPGLAERIQLLSPDGVNTVLQEMLLNHRMLRQNPENVVKLMDRWLADGAYLRRHASGQFDQLFLGKGPHSEIVKRLGGVFGDISEARPYFEDFVVRHGPLPDTLSGQRGYLRTFLTETRENIFRNLLDRETPDRASAIEQKYRSLFRGYQTLFLERVFDSYRADPTNITTPKIDQTAARTFRELSKLEPSKPLRSAVESSQKKIDLAVERVRSEFESDPSFLKRLDEELARKSDEEKIRLASLLNNRMVFDDLELFARFVQRKRS